MKIFERLGHLCYQQVGQADRVEGKGAKALVLLPSGVTHVELQQAVLKRAKHL